MTSSIAEIPLSVLERLEELALHLESLSDDHLLLESVISDLEDLRNEHHPSKCPKSLRRALALLKVLESGRENDIEHLTYLARVVTTGIDSAM